MADIQEMSSPKYTRQRNPSECFNRDVKENILYSELQCNSTYDETKAADTEQIYSDRKHKYIQEDEPREFENIRKCDDEKLNNEDHRNYGKNRRLCDNESRIYVDSHQNSINLIETTDKPAKLNVEEDTVTKYYRVTKDEQRIDDSNCKAPKDFTFQGSVSSYGIEESSKPIKGIEKPNNRLHEVPDVFIDPHNLHGMFQRRSLDNKVFVKEDFGRTQDIKLKRSNAVDEPAPEIYIDMSHNRSDLLAYSNEGTSQASEESKDDTSTYLSDTIFFDPFENRRIDQPREKARHSRPTIQTGFCTLESSNDDGFSLSPIPLSLYPEPPPSYTEISRERNVWAVTEQPTTSDNTVHSRITDAAASTGQKVIVCQHCRSRVHTNTVRECGAATHVIALSFLLFCCLPITLLVYCTRPFKYINHYCPSCNKLVGYEVPILCQKLVLVKPEIPLPLI